MTSDDPATAQPPSTPSASDPPPATTLPTDPAAYDSERAAHARARGLAAPYIAGGVDPEPAEGQAEERRYGRLLLWMVALIVFGGFVLGFIGMLVGGPAT